MKKLNNQGLTLIESILAMAISIIIISSITLFMSAGSRSYQAADAEISVQTETQTIMNQIGDLVQEANNVLYDSTNNTLSLYHIDADTSDDKMEIIWFNSNNNRIYLYNTTYPKKDVDVLNPIKIWSVSEDNLLGEYVTAFSADTGISGSNQFIYDRTGKSSTTLKISLTLMNNNRTYTSTEDIKLRNKIVNIP